MKILKYEKKANEKYKIYLDNSRTIEVTEDVIIDNKLLYKQEISNELLNKLINESKVAEIYNKCVKYISIRLRSIEEMREYLKRKQLDELLIDNTISKLIKNNLLNDDIFVRAFIKDKINFTTMGPYKIAYELKKHNIDQNLINEHISSIDTIILEKKINKQIIKLMKSNQNKPNLKNKIYNNLLSLGYKNDLILTNLNKYNL